ncbi:MAG TPA: hypothetical protein VE111_05870 [Bradyrhizobium sp.]|nr:hypothetical protein [Bradyrhizobium sp.]
MLRWMMPFLAMAVTAASAAAADFPRSGAAVYGKARPVYGRPAYVKEESDLLFTPADGRMPYIRIPPLTPLLPGSSALPGYYGSNHSYEHQGPYYGGPNLSYWYRLPYACGVYGYC